MSRLTKIHSVITVGVTGKTIRARVAVFHNVDFQDRVMPGAFTKSISGWEASGDRPPFIWSHDWSDPFAHLGVVKSMKETALGLEVEAEILDDNPFAKQVQRLIEQRRVTQYSFAYDVVREGMGEDGARELEELSLIECGPCLSGANPLTDTLSRKSVQEMLAREEKQRREDKQRRDPVITDLERQLDELTRSLKAKDEPDPVDEFLREARELYRAEKAEWQRLAELARRPVPLLGPAPAVDARMRPHESAAPIADASNETYRVPIVTRGDETWRLERE